MRNGNFHETCQFVHRSRSSYPTYEEWKHLDVMTLLFWNLTRSYPTYEEWKPVSPL